MDLFRVLMAVKCIIRQKEISEYGPLQSSDVLQKPYFRHCLSHPEKITREGDIQIDIYKGIATNRPTWPRAAELLKTVKPLFSQHIFFSKTVYQKQQIFLVPEEQNKMCL